MPFAVAEPYGSLATPGLFRSDALIPLGSPGHPRALEKRLTPSETVVPCLEPRAEHILFAVRQEISCLRRHKT
jgi:hypothetical protein